MTTIRRSITVSMLLLLAMISFNARAQPPDEDAVFQKLGAQTRALRGTLGDLDQLTRIDADVNALDKARSTALGGRIGPEYRDSLLGDTALLERATAMLQRGDREKAIASVNDAEVDLAIKRRHADATIGFSGAGLRTVDVTARTMRGTKEEPGYVVWFVARGWSDVPGRYARFDALSSPTTAPMAPGSYFMWAGAASDQTRQPIDIGGHGRSRQAIDLPLP